MLKKSLSSLNSFIQKYVGVTSITLISLLTVSLSSCKKDLGGGSDTFGNRSTSAADYSQSTLPVVAVTTDITTAVHWTAGNVYELNGVITVRDGGSLQIDPGTFIKSTVNPTPGPGASANGVLVIAKNGTIDAVGTPANPIVFTSRKLLDGVAGTVGAPGDFGGVIILGNAVTNFPGGDDLIEGLPNLPKYRYGGTNNTDNRGNFKYVRIEFAGFQLAPNKEVNGLTLGSVGSGTQISHVQVSWGLDDGFEFFGGTVSPKNLVAYANDDDQFDFDNGYTGSIQYAIAVANAYSTHSGTTTPRNSDSNGIESDNNDPADNASFTLIPKTHPILSNFSIIGTADTTLSPAIPSPGLKYAYRNRRGAEVSLTNSLVTGYPRGIVFDADASATPSTVNANTVHGFSAAISVATGTFIGTNTVSIGVPAPKLNIKQPWANSPGTPGSFDFAVTSGTRGAIPSGTPNWTANWTKFVF